MNDHADDNPGKPITARSCVIPAAAGHRIICAFLVLLPLAAAAFGLRTADVRQDSSGGAISATGGLWPNLAGNIERPLRYRPEGTDFVIENGAEFFNRPLYGGNTASMRATGRSSRFTCRAAAEICVWASKPVPL
jgi:hypothetical protein